MFQFALRLHRPDDFRYFLVRQGRDEINSSFIQGALGTVISMELPEIGDRIEQDEVFAELESVSTVHELLSPVSGKVLAVNPDLDDHPSIINEDPYNDGWLIEVRLMDDSKLDSLMDMDEYYHFVFKDKF